MESIEIEIKLLWIRVSLQRIHNTIISSRCPHNVSSFADLHEGYSNYDTIWFPDKCIDRYDLSIRCTKYQTSFNYGYIMYIATRDVCEVDGREEWSNSVSLVLETEYLGPHGGHYQLIEVPHIEMNQTIHIALVWKRHKVGLVKIYYFTHWSPQSDLLRNRNLFRRG